MSKSVHWPTLEAELKPYISELTGKVLNAGCGSRKLHIPNASSVVNIDIIDSEIVDSLCSVDDVPYPNEEFDSILNVAVLEHVEFPWKAVEEFARLLKPRGKLLCVVPFMQPIHYVPTDFFRFTPQGISSLLENAGFQIDQLTYTHTIWHTLGWLLDDARKEAPWYSRWLLSIFSPFSFALSRFSSSNITSAPNAITVIATKKLQAKNNLKK